MKALATLTACLVSTTIFAGTITVKDETGAAVKDAKVFFVHPAKKIYKTQATNEKGEADIKTPNNDAVIVFCAHDNYRAFRKEGVTPEQPLEIRMQKQDGTGSIVFADGSGMIPGLKGRMNPIWDTIVVKGQTKDRFYLYADNISINEGKEQPVGFELNKSLKLEDADGNCFDVTIIDIIQSTSLIEFKKTK